MNLSKILTKEQIEFLSNLTQKMKTQDNRGTAQPYGLVIGQKRRQITDWDMADDFMVYWDEGTYDSFDEFFNAIKEYYLEDEEQSNVVDYIEEHCEDMDGLRYHAYQIGEEMGNDGGISVVGYTVVESFSNDHCGGNFFLTDDAAKRYVEANKHNLTEPFTYGVHLYRNREMDKLYEVLGVLGQQLEVEKEKKCLWSKTNDFSFVGCNAKSLDSDQISKFNNCPFCGGKIEVI
jgi:hypothetical protein